MNGWMLTTLVLGVLSPGASIAQAPTQKTPPSDSAAASPTAPGDLDGRPSLALMAIIGAAGGAVGLYLGPRGGLLGPLVGSALGTALGLELASQGRVPSQRAAGAALLGTLAGVTTVTLASEAIRGSGAFYLAYSLPQGLLAALMASGRGGGAR